MPDTEKGELPDQFYKNLVCSQCFMYLTVLPIRVNKNGETICGRHDSVDLGAPSLLNIIMPNYFFKCVNHFEGCYNLLDTGISSAHEEKCEVRSIECTFCSFKGNWCQILLHTEKDHPFNLLNNGAFNFKYGHEFSKSFLYLFKNNIYSIAVKVTLSKICLTICASALNDYNLDNYLVIFSKYPTSNKQIILYNSCFKNIARNCFEQDFNEIMLYGWDSLLTCQILFESIDLSKKEAEMQKRMNVFNKKLSELVQRQKSLEELNLKITSQRQTFDKLMSLCKHLFPLFGTCNECKSIIQESFYFCKNVHTCCEQCLSNENECNQCGMTPLTKSVNLHEIIISCDWPHCNKTQTLADYLLHKRNCSQRPYKCPISTCLEVVLSSDLIKHWHDPSAPLIASDVLSFDDYKRVSCFWLICGDLYQVKIHYDGSIVNVVIAGTNNILINHVMFKVFVFDDSNYKYELTNNAKYVGDTFVLICSDQGYSEKIEISIK